MSGAERTKVWVEEQGCFVDKDQIDQGRNNQGRGGQNRGQRRGQQRGGQGQGQPGGQNHRPMNQRGRNQGPMNQGNEGSMNQRGPNQGPMNQRGPNQGPMNQRGPNQGPMNQRGPNQGFMNQRGQYQDNFNQGFHNQGQYGNSDAGYRDGYGNQGPQGQQRGNAGLLPTPSSFYGGPPPLIGQQQYVQHVIQPVVMPPVYGYQAPPTQPPPLFPPSYYPQQNNFNNGESYQQQGYGNRQPEYGKGDKRNMQRSSSQMSVDSVGRQSDDCEQGGRGCHRGRGGNARGNNRRGRMERSASTMDVDSTGRLGDDDQEGGLKDNRGGNRGRGQQRGRNDRGGMGRSFSTMSVDGVGRKSDDSRGGRGGRGHFRGRNDSGGNMGRSSNNLSVDSNGSDHDENNHRNDRPRRCSSGQQPKEDRISDDASMGARPKEYRDGKNRRPDNYNNRRTGRGNSVAGQNSERHDEMSDDNQRNRPNMRGQRGRGNYGPGQRGRGQFETGQRGRGNLRRGRGRRPYNNRRNVDRTRLISDQSDERSNYTVSDEESVEDETSRDGRRLNNIIRGGKGRSFRGQGSRDMKGRFISRGRGNSTRNNQGIEADSSSKEDETEYLRHNQNVPRSRNRRAPIRGRWKGFVGRGKYNDSQSCNKHGSDASDDFDDNVSVVSDISMATSSIADEASIQSLEEKQEIKLDDINTVGLQTLKNRLVRYTKKLASMKKKNENIESIKKFESQIEEIRKVKAQRNELEKKKGEAIENRNDECKMELSSPEDEEPTELTTSTKMKKPPKLVASKGRMSFRPKTNKLKGKRTVEKRANIEGNKNSGDEQEEMYENDLDEIDVGAADNSKGSEDEKVSNLRKNRKRIRNKKNADKKEAKQNADCLSNMEQNKILSDLSSKLDSLLMDETPSHDRKLPDKRETDQRLGKGVNAVNDSSEGTIGSHNGKKERREKKSSASETNNNSDMVDENEVFKFLVKNLDGHGTPEEIKRESGLFPAAFNELSWFKIHRRRFLVLGENDSKCIVVAFYKQATYCKFYITSRSCQKDCGRYHICKNLLLGHCKFGGEKCKFSHDFLDERNLKVSKELGFSNVFTSDEICSLMKVRFPHVCQNWAETGSCSMPDCIGLHLCPRYLLGKCLEGKDCPLLHDKTSPHNKPIIEAYGMSDWQESMFRQMVYISRESTNEGDNHSNDKEEAVTGATSDVLYTQVPENSADSQVPGKKKLPKIEVVDIETSDEASKKYICEDYIIDKCRRPKCQKMHTCTKMPYLWQVNLFGKWTNLLQSEQVETEFCGYSEKSSGILERHNDIDMEIVVLFDKNQKAVVKILTTDDGAMICDWRRLSTLSYTQGDMNNEGFKTQWRWYWKDDHERWNLFEPDSFQHTLERKFLAKQDVFYFSRENYRFKLKVDFEEMSQLNLETRKNRVLLRRPVFVSSEDVKNGQSGCPLAAAPVVETKLPRGWVPWDLANPFELVMLDENSPDYNTVADSFYSTLRRTEQKIDSIYRMQNHKLWSLFCNQEKIMEANLRRMGRDGQVDTRYLFHGTDSLDAVRGISINNFDVRVSGKNATMYGDGAYFARDAKYSHSYTKPPERFMFMVKVLVGEYTKGDKSYRRPPQKPGNNHELFDSCVNDEANPSIFIVFDKNQYYPEYLIQYRNVNEVDSQQSAYVPSVPKPRPAPRTPHSPTQSSQSFGNNANSGDTSISWYSPNASQQYPANPISYPSTYSTSSTASQQYPADPISYPSTSSIPSTANQQYTSNPTSFSSNTSSSASADKKYTYTAEPSKPKKKDESCSIQ